MTGAIAVVVFVAAYVLIATERVPKVVTALAGTITLAATYLWLRYFFVG